MLSGSSESTSPRSGRSECSASAYPRSPSPLSTKATRLVDGRGPGRGSAGDTAPVTTSTSVHRRVVGEARDVGEAVTLAPQHVAPERARLGRERVAHLGVDDVPVAARDLVLQLTCIPAGVAGEDPQAGE